MKVVRTTVFWLHMGVGCVAGLVILVMYVTGLLRAFERQINTWADVPAVLQEQSDSTAAPAPLESILAGLKSNGQGVPSELVLHNSGNAPAEARFGRKRTLYLGRSATGAANLAFLFMLVSGLYVWLPKVLSVTSLKSRLLFRRGLQGRAREGNWHNVIGIWTAVPLLFIVLSGVIMSYGWASNLLYKVTGTQPPARDFKGERGPRGNAASSAPPLEARTLDDLAPIAKQQIPQWMSITIEVPQPQDRTLDVSVDKSVGGQPEKATQLVLDRHSGHIDVVKRFSDNNAGRKLRAWARFLHTGEEFGVLGEAVAAIACLGAVMLVWTGLSMAIRRAAATTMDRLKREPQTVDSATEASVESDMAVDAKER
jgi:uncharacterized iron-regulated membrane protein